jgi:hypothetical protein
VADSGGLLSRCTGLKPCTEGSNPSLSAIESGRGRVDHRRRTEVSRGARLAAVLCSVALSGCVERYFRIETEPIGARIYINGEDAGVSPVERPFTHYGTMRVDAHFEKQPGVTQFVELVPPWYQYFPLDVFSELLDPVTHVDRHTVTITFPEPTSEPAAERESAVRRNAEQLRAESR